MERTSKCLCGQFSVIVTGEPAMVNARQRSSVSRGKAGYLFLTIGK